MIKDGGTSSFRNWEIWTHWLCHFSCYVSLFINWAVWRAFLYSRITWQSAMIDSRTGGSAVLVLFHLTPAGLEWSLADVLLIAVVPISRVLDGKRKCFVCIDHFLFVHTMTLVWLLSSWLLLDSNDGCLVKWWSPMPIWGAFLLCWSAQCLRFSRRIVTFCWAFPTLLEISRFSFRGMVALVHQLKKHCPGDPILHHVERSV